MQERARGVPTHNGAEFGLSHRGVGANLLSSPHRSRDMGRALTIFDLSKGLSATTALINQPSFDILIFYLQLSKTRHSIFALTKNFDQTLNYEFILLHYKCSWVVRVNSCCALSLSLSLAQFLSRNSFNF